MTRSIASIDDLCPLFSGQSTDMTIDFEAGWDSPMYPTPMGSSAFSSSSPTRSWSMGARVPEFPSVRDFDPLDFKGADDVAEAIYGVSATAFPRMGFWNGELMGRDYDGLRMIVPVVSLEEIGETLVARGLLPLSIFEQSLPVDTLLMAACDPSAWLQARELKLEGLVDPRLAARYEREVGSLDWLYVQLLEGRRFFAGRSLRIDRPSFFAFDCVFLECLFEKSVTFRTDKDALSLFSKYSPSAQSLLERVTAPPSKLNVRMEACVIQGSIEVGGAESRFDLRNSTIFGRVDAQTNATVVLSGANQFNAGPYDRFVTPEIRPQSYMAPEAYMDATPEIDGRPGRRAGDFGGKYSSVPRDRRNKQQPGRITGRQRR